MFRGRRRVNGPRYGKGRGYGRGYGSRGYGYRSCGPNCDWYPDRPRGWWTMPEYEGAGFTAPPAGAKWDPYGKPETPEAIEYEISLIQRQVEALQKEIEQLKLLDKPAK